MLVPLVVMAGCTADPVDPLPSGGDDPEIVDPDTASETASPPPEPCDNVVVSVDPASGATEIPPAAAVTFTLAEPDPAAVVTVTDAAGALVAGVTTVDGAVVSWVADPPLAWASAYTATLDHTCGTDGTSWTTGPWDPTGIVFAVGLAEAEWNEPIGLILAALLDLPQMLVEVTAASFDPAAPTLDLRVALGEADVQDRCSPTTDVAGAAYTEPDLVVALTELQLPIGGTWIPFHEVEWTGSFLQDRSAVEDVQILARLDTRPLGRAVELGDEPGAVCDFVATFNLLCDACPDGTPYCLDVLIDASEAPAVAGPLVERTVPDIAADPSCD